MSESNSNNILPASFKRACYFFSFTFLILAIIYNLYWHFILPIGLGLFFNFLLFPVAIKLERQRKIPRLLSSGVFLLLALIFLTIFCLSFLPYLYRELTKLAQMLPATINIFFDKWVPSVREFLIVNKFMKTEEFERLLMSIQDFSQLSNQAVPALQTVLNTLPKVISILLNIILVPIITFFLLLNSERLARFFTRLIPLELKDPTLKCLGHMNATMRSLITGQVLIAFIMGILYPIGLLIIGFPSAVTIGVLIGVARIIPYLDIVVGVSLCSIVVFSDFTSWLDFLPVAIVLTTIISLDGMLITPKILGKKSGLHPFIVIISLFAFAKLFGFWGFILAIPTVALTKDLVFFMLPYYYESNFYRKNFS